MASANANAGVAVSYTANQIADMPLEQQTSVMASLSPADQKAVQSAILNKTQRANRKFMQKSFRQYVSMPVSGGNVTTATYSAGQTLSFDFPLVTNGYALGVLVTVSMTVNPATGSSAAYAKNAAAPYNVFQEVDVFYNGSQIKGHPYIESKVMSMLSGYQKGINNTVVAGQDNSTLDTTLAGSCPITVNTNNAWTFKMFIPFNKRGKDDIAGALPINGLGTRGQFKLTCASSFLGYDPLNNVISAVSGSGHAVTVSSATVTCDVLTVNGTNGDSPTPYTADLTNEPTIQSYWGSPLAPLTANLLVKKQLEVLLEHWYVIALVIDGVQSTAFSTISNLQQLSLTPDSSSANALYHYNVADNVSFYDYYWHMRERYGQDLDIGCVPIVDATASGVNDSTNRNGVQTLNMQSGGYPGANVGVYVGSVSSTNITPRVEIFYISKNNTGLKRVGN